MTDRELLELAAKAAGYEYAKHGGYIVIDGIPRNWNPLENDGDALRLAVNLGIDLGFAGSSVRAIFYPNVPIIEQDVCVYAATRRAIVRAAAEIGRAKP